MADIEEVKKRLQKRIPPGWWQGIDIGPGWIPIVDQLDKALAELNPNYEINQVKEKFGTLRFYVSGVSKEGDRLILEAEQESERTCEECGKQDDTVECRGGKESQWIKTLCSEDREKVEQAYLDRRNQLITLSLEN